MTSGVKPRDQVAGMRQDNAEHAQGAIFCYQPLARTFKSKNYFIELNRLNISKNEFVELSLLGVSKN